MEALSASFDKVKMENSTILEEPQKLKQQRQEENCEAQTGHWKVTRALMCLQDRLDNVDEKVDALEERGGKSF
ncbi:hypothetical protein MMC30_004044 [Trapelia coarctata]|nr:hypothetical protein [Trapelia coarctata]